MVEEITMEQPEMEVEESYWQRKVKIPSMDKQIKAVWYVKDTFTLFSDLTKTHRAKLLDIYESYSTFTQPKQAERQTTFKVNKSHEVVNKILPRLMAKNPKWIVSVRTDEFDVGGEMQTDYQELVKMSKWVQDYLTYIFDKYNQREPLRLRAKNMVVYGNAYAKIKYKYDVTRTYEKWGINEKVIWEYPTIEPKSRTDIYYDPRYVMFDDMAGIIETISAVRLAELEANKDKYFNIDKIKGLPNMEEWQDEDGYKKRVFLMSGVNQSYRSKGIDKNNLTLKTFYGLYSEEEGKDEQLYKITTVDDVFVICYEPISCIPFEDIKCFEDTETHYAVGFVEPILGLQDEMNFKKNSASEYINQSLNRSWIWSPNSWINPKDLDSKPGNIIVTSKDVQTAMQNLIELPMRSLPIDYFQEQNDLERQIQAMTFTVDTSNPQNQQALTNTATGIRVKFFESNSVIDEVRKHFEEGMEKLAYKLLQVTYENMEDNMIIKKIGWEGYREMNKELLRDAMNRYLIKVEVGSSSYDTLEQRREDAIAQRNLMVSAAQAGVNVDLTEWFKDVLSSFEKKDVNKYIKPEQSLDQLMQQGGWWQMQVPEQKPTEAEAVTQNVARGNIMSASQ